MLRLTKTRTKQEFSFAIVNDCFSVMEELDSLRSEYEHVVQEHKIEFRDVTQSFVMGGLVGIQNVALQIVEALRGSLNRAVALLAYEDDGDSSQSSTLATGDDKDETEMRGQRHRKAMNEVLGTLRRELKKLQDSLCDYFFRKALVAVARELVVVYCRALYVYQLNLHLSRSNIPNVKSHTCAKLIQIRSVYVRVCTISHQPKRHITLS